MAELKPCPFCGGEPEYHIDEKGIDVEDMKINPNVVHFVWCHKCMAVISCDSKAGVIEAWNRRATDVDNH